MTASVHESARDPQTEIVRKPRALPFEPIVVPFAPASPGEKDRLLAGVAELHRLRWKLTPIAQQSSEGYFAASTAVRHDEFLAALGQNDAVALVAIRGGYGSNYLLDGLDVPSPDAPKILLGFSDLTSLQVFLWQKHRWVSFYGPMVAAGFDRGAGHAHGYDEMSLLAALQSKAGGWTVNLQGETLLPGRAEGRILGGCLTLVETTLGTPWELDTRGAILILEDRAMKPWQVDRALMHMAQAGKLEHASGIVLGDFPECDPPVAGSPTVRNVASRILGPLGVPVVYGTPVGHTPRPMLTLPLGITARLVAEGPGKLEILEPAVVS